MSVNIHNCYSLCSEIRTSWNSWHLRTLEEEQTPSLHTLSHGILSGLWSSAALMNYNTWRTQTAKVILSPNIQWLQKLILHFTCVLFFFLFFFPYVDNQLFELGCEEFSWPGGPDGGSEESKQFLDYGVWELWRHHGYCLEYYFVSFKCVFYLNISGVSDIVIFIFALHFSMQTPLSSWLCLIRYTWDEKTF